MWNDTDIPIAYLITFRCYGTWLHGDKRGSVNRFRNTYRTRFLPKEDKWVEVNSSRMKAAPVTLDAHRRQCVESAIRETCEKRGWALLAISVRTNHVHVVVWIGEKSPSMALNAFKANATRKMRTCGCWMGKHSPWSDKGSQRNLWNQMSVSRAVNYVVNGQGDDLPDFD